MEEQSSGFGKTLALIIVALVIAVSVNKYVIQSKVVMSGSMEPTLHVGERILINRLAYQSQSPARGDVIEFVVPSGQDFMKRVIGVAGDTVEVRQGMVYINDQPTSEPYVTIPANYAYGPVTVPEGDLFVLGDNRNESDDSHSWGFLETKKVEGKVIAVYMPISSARLVKVNN
ncbi:MAG: signal peptidase I [Acidobacteriota bacterium]